MQFILKNLAKWVFNKHWFLATVMELITKALQETPEKRTTKQQNIFNFILLHKRSIGSIIKKELNDDSSVVNTDLSDAIKSVKPTKPVKPTKK